MFTQPCFIRKYSKKLCENLESLGLELMNSSDTTLDCHNYDGKGNHRHIDEGKAIITYQSSHYGVIYDIDDVTKKGRIDCGTNERLFLAVAAIRDDTDKYQWFVYDYDDNWKDVGDSAKKGDFVLCTTDKYYCGTDVRSAHKATVEELIEHFKYK